MESGVYYIVLCSFRHKLFGVRLRGVRGVGVGVRGVRIGVTRRVGVPTVARLLALFAPPPVLVAQFDARARAEAVRADVDLAFFQRVVAVELGRARRGNALVHAQRLREHLRVAAEWRRGADRARQARRAALPLQLLRLFGLSNTRW